MRLLLPLILALSVGCASMKTTCRYYPDGVLETYSLRSTVIGTGETETISQDCALIAYSTEDTGLSDNGKDALEGVAEAAVRASAAASAAGLVGGMLPTP